MPLFDTYKIANFLRDKQSQQQVGTGLLDAANRGLVAQTIGAPVDAANALTNLLYAGVGYTGNKLGLLNADQMPAIPDPKDVVGSSEWWGNKLAQGGFLSENRNPVAETLAGLLAPVAYKGAQKTGGLLYNAESNALANASKPSTMTMQGQRGAVNIGSMGEQNIGYQGSHKPQSIKNGASPLHDMTGTLPEDFYSKNGLNYYGSGDPREAHVFKVMQQVRGKPDALVTIYRGVPDQVDGKINPGDWVSLSPEYASDYGRVVSMKVPAKHLSASGDSLLEQGYFPE